jgi:hypothetical protein
MAGLCMSLILLLLSVVQPAVTKVQTLGAEAIVTKEGTRKITSCILGSIQRCCRGALDRAWGPRDKCAVFT